MYTRKNYERAKKVQQRQQHKGSNWAVWAWVGILIGMFLMLTGWASNAFWLLVWGMFGTGAGGVYGLMLAFALLISDDKK